VYLRYVLKYLPGLCSEVYVLSNKPLCYRRMLLAFDSLVLSVIMMIMVEVGDEK